MKNKPRKYWKIVFDENAWPTIQSCREDCPLIIFSNRTVLGQRAALRWAEFICDWMNEQMRLGLATEKRCRCDPMLTRENRKLSDEVTALNFENQRIHGEMMKLKRKLWAVERALAGKGEL